MRRGSGETVNGPRRNPRNIPSSAVRAETMALDSSIPSELLPTPDQQRRRRSTKSPRIGPSFPSSATSLESSSAAPAPVSTLQRLSHFRKTSAASTPVASGSLTPISDTPEFGGGTAAPVAKPMSKLALLAQKRKEAAAAKSSPSAPSDCIPSPSAAAASSSMEPMKPLSKLAQKAAAAQAAREETKTMPTPSEHRQSEEELNADFSQLALDEETAELFATSSTVFSPRPHHRDSSFFHILTSSDPRPLQPVTDLSIHLPFDSAGLEKRVMDAFGPDTQSPDDIVLRARQGRAGPGVSAIGSGKVVPRVVQSGT